MLKKSDNSGFTLIELLLYLALLGVVLGAIIAFLSLSVSIRSRTEVISEVERQGNFLTEAIKSAVASSTGVNYPTAGNSSSSLSLAFAGYAAANPTFFYLSGTDLLIKYDAAAPIALNDYSVAVSNLSFVNVSKPSTKDLIKFSFTVSYNSATSSLAGFNYSKNFYGSVSRKK